MSAHGEHRPRDAWLDGTDRLADWAATVVDPEPHDLGELAEWAAEVTEPEPEA